MIQDTECSQVRKVRFHSIDEAIDFLKRHGKRIGELSNRGFKEANDVVKWYNMLYTSPGDPGAQALLMVALEDYLDKSVAGEYSI